MGRFDGQVVLITGGARGQGRSHAVEFAREGADIAVCDIDAQIASVPYPTARSTDLDETAKLVAELGRRYVTGVVDVRDPAGLAGFVAQTRSELGRIDVLLTNAGIFSFGSVAEMSDATWTEMLEVNLTGTFRTMRAVLPTMLEQRSGRIIATSSSLGKTGQPNVAHYVAAKWGVIGLVKSLALEVGGHGITVNALCPTNVDTDMIHNEAAYGLFRPDLEHPTRADVAAAFQGAHAVPVGWVDALDVSKAALFLASDEARYITGETLAVAAGATARNAG